MADSQTSIVAACLCRAHSFTVSVPKTALPLEATCCHCDSCRHLTGALYFPNVEWPRFDEDLSGLKLYPYSKNLDMFFCATCSSLMFWRHAGTAGPAYVVTSAVENAPNLVRYLRHIFVGDTVDGGASMWLRKSQNGAAALARRWIGYDPEIGPPSEEVPYAWPDASTLPAAEAKAAPELTPFRCHCGGVDLVLRSANDLDASPEGELPWFVDPVTRKYLATLDACDSCRLSAGADLPNWTFALLSHIAFPATTTTAAAAAAAAGVLAGEAAKERGFPTSAPALQEAVASKGGRDDSPLGTLTYYASSPEVQRYFCSRCSASVFYVRRDRPDVVNVAVGLLHHPGGARAEGLLAWNYGRVSWIEDVEGGWREGIAAGALHESEEWRVQRAYPKTWLRLKVETCPEEGARFPG